MTKEHSAQLDKILQTDTGQQMVTEYEQIRAADHAKKNNVLSSIINWIRPPEMMLRYHPDLTAPPTSVLFGDANNRKLALNVGGGPNRESPFEFTLNIEPFPNVDIVADAHNIPLQDGSFDSVFSVAVLEHVTSPELVVEEMIRVLKPGGYFYSEIPFMFFFHGYPSDFRRYTKEGIKLLFTDLVDVEIGLTHGPVSATLQSVNMLIGILIPQRLPRLRKLINGLFRWVFFPLKYLDLLVKDHQDAHILAGGFYVLGRKHSEPQTQAN